MNEPVSETTSRSKRQIKGTLIQHNDRKVYVTTDGLDITPTVLYSIVIGVIAFQITSVKEINPTGTSFAMSAKPASSLDILRALVSKPRTRNVHATTTRKNAKHSGCGQQC